MLFSLFFTQIRQYTDKFPLVIDKDGYVDIGLHSSVVGSSGAARPAWTPPTQGILSNKTLESM